MPCAPAEAEGYLVVFLRIGLTHPVVQNVTLIFDESWVSMDGRAVVTDKGSRIECDLVFPCLGGIPNTEFLRGHFDGECCDHGPLSLLTVRRADAMTATGYIKVDPKTLLVEGHANVFALGDICDLPEEKLAQTGTALIECQICFVGNFVFPLV